ncbi:MAG: 50S ribosomal protein L22 [Phycisphaerae bacterium]|nr:50S ribosomal protein L22 [Phycisphaerae bacterium]
MPWSATHRGAQISARKARLVIDMIRGRNAAEALDLLKFTPKRASYMIRKVLQSAVSNAQSQGDADREALFVSAARIDEGTPLKRLKMGDRGRMFVIKRRTSHIHIEVDQAQA